ncbi:CoxG family protein [Verminephrobacter eiseniae]|uniref:CoxG family protein n=1 Tax=Verminephrobacter eiseniae TaxID=364317 RepID=UPI002237A9FE|nr:carbon monoxide dehydrogenase subunit G [Verminephrobacter eiseniae]MCW5238687.1 carbon monoxide dehydrogenase [Verminephrobacter eiseniae]
MQMQASRPLAVSQQQAWEALNDPEVLKLCIPGCGKIEPSGENQYAVAMALKIGPVSAKFTGKITLTDIVPPESYQLAFDGSGGVAGFGKGQAQISLQPDGEHDAQCMLHYTAHASVGGKIAQLGQRLIDGAAKTMAEDFFQRFDNEMQRRHPRAEQPQAQAAPIDAPAPDGSPSTRPRVPAVVWAAVGIAALVLVTWWLNRS